ALPFGMARHAREICEDRRDLLVRAPLGRLEPAGHLLEVRLVTAVEIGGEQVVLALEVVVERALGMPGLFGHGVAAAAAAAFGIEKFRRRVDETLAGGIWLLAHPSSIPTSEYTGNPKPAPFPALRTEKSVVPEKEKRHDRTRAQRNPRPRRDPHSQSPGKAE